MKSGQWREAGVPISGQLKAKSLDFIRWMLM
jgi:hypothetical protein